MKRCIHSKLAFLTIVFSAFLSVVCCVQLALASKNESSIDKVIQKSKINKNHLGLIVQNGSKVIYELNSEKLFIPASITKIATSYSVLKHFPQGFKFKTQLLSDGKVKEQTLKGSLYLKGGGDPSFVSENMWFLVNAFTRQNIKLIEGDIIVDDSLFDQERFDLSRQKERVDRAYDAPVGAMSFNWNSVNLFVKPTEKGKPAKIVIDPENDFVELTGQIKTSDKTEMSANRIEKDNGAKIEVQGYISLYEKEKPLYVNVGAPNLWAGENLKSFLRQRGIEIQGRVKAGIAPATADVLAESEGSSIEKILTDMNKFSNNFVAEMLTKNMHAQTKQPATLSGGVEIINQDLKALGLKPDEFNIVNPSGLTRKNKMSPAGMMKILTSVQSDFRVMPEFLVSLPISGIDGTLKKRMTKSDSLGLVRAKTGFLTDVVSLAGFTVNKNQTIVPFVFIFNGTEDEAKVRELFDNLCEQIKQL